MFYGIVFVIILVASFLFAMLGATCPMNPSQRLRFHDQRIPLALVDLGDG